MSLPETRSAPASSPSTNARSHPRPQTVRPQWASLDGPWDFTTAAAPDRSAPSDVVFDQTIHVPYPAEASASGAQLPAGHSILWYRRTLTDADLEGAGLGRQGERAILHFGAVDFVADVWLDNQHLAHHEGGHAPFTVELPLDVIHLSGSTRQIVVRVEDDPHDVEQPRGKQDWRDEPHSIWYHRTSGIWQTVWLEAVPDQHVASLAWTAHVPDAHVELEVRLAHRPAPETDLTVRLEWRGELLAEQRVRALDPHVRMMIAIPRQSHGQQYEELLWSPETPRLLDATVSIDTPGGAGDRVDSYVGLRSVEVDRGVFLLNDRPYYLRGVLDQGFWPDTHLAAPETDSFRAEVQLIKDLGFNAVRLHQKAEDPRFLAWADRLGLLVWGEMASAYAFSSRAVRLLASEWLEIVDRDRSHPSVVTWVAFNESWGVQHGVHDPAQRAYVAGLTSLIRAVDPSRPVVSNDGWEHGDSDILGVHDYAASGGELRRHYRDATAVTRLLQGMGPAGRRLRLTDTRRSTPPIMLTEFGGISFAGHPAAGGWGYSTANSADEYAARLRDLFDAVLDSDVPGTSSHS